MDKANYNSQEVLSNDPGAGPSVIIIGGPPPTTTTAGDGNGLECLQQQPPPATTTTTTTTTTSSCTTNKMQTEQVCGLITYMKHICGSYNSGIATQDDPFHPFSPDEWSQQTPTMMSTYLIQSLPDPHGPEPVLSGPISSSRPTGYSAAALELMGFK